MSPIRRVVESWFVLAVASDFRKLLVEFESQRGYSVVQHRSLIVRDDINGDDISDICDLIIVASHYGETTP